MSSWVGGASNRGQRHSENEDALALRASIEPNKWAVMVVCDGVSSAPGSAAAARTVADVIVTDVDGAHLPAERDTRRTVIANALTAASRRANATIADPSLDRPPACTLATAVIDDTDLLVGWVGDSRAYWIPDGAPVVQLTRDDSVAQMRIDLGVPRDVAESSMGAHTITRWLGGGATDVDPRFTHLELIDRGWVLVCSDGLWNYCADGDTVAQLIAAGPDTPAELASYLVDWANQQGGVDNITAVVARINPAPIV